MDRITKEQRSKLMSKVKGKNTKLELMLFELLQKNGFLFESHYAILGKPDIVFIEKKLAIFIDGDFWHGWKFETYKNKLTKYWLNKIHNNILRDKRNRGQLRKEGWRVIRFWEHRVLKRPFGCISRISKELGK